MPAARRPAGRRSARLGALLVAVAVVGVVGLSSSAASSVPAPSTDEARSWTSGPCPTTAGVTVVVDLTAFDLGIHVRCAPGSPSSGFAALAGAGFEHRTAVRSPGFLCRIDGHPADDPCVNAAPASAYWSYWLASRGGQWCYSNLGAGNRQPPPGTVEGWSFSRSTSGAQAAPPGVAPPPPPAGTSTPSLGSGDCDPAVAPTPTTTTTTIRPPTTTRPSAPSGGNGHSSGPSSGGTAPSGPVVAPAAPNDAARTSPTTAPSTTTTTSEQRTTTTTAGAQADAFDAEAPSGAQRVDGAGDLTEEETTRRASRSDAAEVDDEAAAGVTIVDEDGGGSFPTGMVVGGALVASLGIGAIVTSRRRDVDGPSAELGSS
ncbi:MAG: hypothetical protein JJU45_02550 [Acidimicrobiia bacterium]|nr:hypothetical protein [Acidimicrobiia bacterium]